MLFDCHTHVGPTWLGTEPLTPDSLIAWMDEAGIDRAVVLPLESPEAASYYSTTRDVLDATDAHPERLVPFCSVDPRMDFGRFDRREGIARLLDDYVESGARGFGEIKCDLPIDDERMQIIYEACAERGLPLLFHLDHLSMTDEVGLPGLERMLSTFPDADFVVHSHAWWSHVSADVRPADLQRGAMPAGPVERGGRCGELLETHSNLYADLSAGSGWNALVRDDKFGQAFLERHHRQLLFGTDKSYAGYEPQQVDLFDRFSLSATARRKIGSRNLERILA